MMDAARPWSVESIYNTIKDHTPHIIEVEYIHGDVPDHPIMSLYTIGIIEDGSWWYHEKKYEWMLNQNVKRWAKVNI